ncbi:MAG: DNA primase [Chlamydiales bacterium]
MSFFRKQSLEVLKERVNLIEVVSRFVELKSSGSAYKGLCPFHDEKTPSFVIQKGDSHYHCYGCGAHGDAIQFLINHQNYTFSESIEQLAQQFGILMEKEDDSETEKGTSRLRLYELLHETCQFFEFFLLYTKEGHQALNYLYDRGIDLEFIRYFRIGFAPFQEGYLSKYLNSKKFSKDEMISAGLLVERDGKRKDFFHNRIMFPIHALNGKIIGFSGRNYQDTNYGGKYKNTPETPVFKKSRVLFALNYSRRRIAKDKQALIVEGQIDALRLIKEGFDFTVAAQGTAFGTSHLEELLKLGITRVFLCLDSDRAGLSATEKIGQLFQKKGIETICLSLPQGMDPDLFVRTYGHEAFIDLMESGQDYLEFLVKYHSKEIDVHSPTGKTRLIEMIANQIKSWDSEILVHESLQKLAQITKTPKDLIGLNAFLPPNPFVKMSGSLKTSLKKTEIDPDRILESDLIKWLIIAEDKALQLLEIIDRYIDSTALKNEECKIVYEKIKAQILKNHKCSLLDLAASLEEKGQELLSSIMNKKTSKEKTKEGAYITVQKILERNWMEQRAEIMQRLQQANLSYQEEEALLKQYDNLKNHPPTIETYS